VKNQPHINEMTGDDDSFVSRDRFNQLKKDFDEVPKKDDPLT
jgi:hypothetical protein